MGGTTGRATRSAVKDLTDAAVTVCVQLGSTLGAAATQSAWCVLWRDLPAPAQALRRSPASAAVSPRRSEAALPRAGRRTPRRSGCQPCCGRRTSYTWGRGERNAACGPPPPMGTSGERTGQALDVRQRQRPREAWPLGRGGDPGKTESGSRTTKRPEAFGS